MQTGTSNQSQSKFPNLPTGRNWVTYSVIWMSNRVISSPNKSFLILCTYSVFWKYYHIPICKHRSWCMYPWSRNCFRSCGCRAGHPGASRCSKSWPGKAIIFRGCWGHFLALFFHSFFLCWFRCCLVLSPSSKRATSNWGPVVTQSHL